MLPSILFRAAAVLLALGTLGHTFGGMLGTARKGPQAGPEADHLFAEMKSVRFHWRGHPSTWYGFWLGNGLGVSALLLPIVVVLWVLGSVLPGESNRWLAIGWTTVVSLGGLSALGFRFFGARIGVVFGLIAALTAVGSVMLA
jgi:hypothetical protein